MIKFELAKEKSILDFLAAFFLVSILYRILFFISAYSSPFEPVPYQIRILAFGLESDAIAGLILTVLFYIIRKVALLFSKKNHHVEKFMTLLLDSVIFFIFFLICLVYIINHKIFALLHIGLNYTILKSYLSQTFSLNNLIPFINNTDLLILVFMFGIYLFIKVIPKQVFYPLTVYFLLPSCIIISICGGNMIKAENLRNPNSRFMAMYANPLSTIFITFMNQFNQYNDIKIQISQTQLHSIKLIDPSFLSPHTHLPLDILLRAPQKRDEHWNIVIFVLESAGSHYIFQKISENNIPMPFLQQLSKQGLWFQNNYSSGNISALGEFSLFTGLYPDPIPAHFEMQESIAMPTLANWLGKSYDSFFVSASNDHYFALGINKTFSEYDNANTIDPNEKKLFSNMFCDENKGFHFFLERLKKAKTPFLGVYWSGATHFPYKDYGSPLEVIDNLTSNAHQFFKRYINNLYLVDQEIKQTYSVLKSHHLLNKTIFVIIGDHGELFGQHEQVFAHGRTLYQEEITVPFLIYAPTLFKGHTIRHVTSSVDLLPTLLDIIKIPYGSKLQGESLLSHPWTREYVFAYNDQDEIAAIDRNNIKMLISFSKNHCHSYDLSKDKSERHPLPCNNLQQEDAILKFRNFQPKILTRFKRDMS